MEKLRTVCVLRFKSRHWRTLISFQEFLWLIKPIKSLTANKKNLLPSILSCFWKQEKTRWKEAAFSANHSLCLPCGLSERPRWGINSDEAWGGGEKRQWGPWSLNTATGSLCSPCLTLPIGRRKGERRGGVWRCLKPKRRQEGKLRLTEPVTNHSTDHPWVAGNVLQASS